MERISKRVEDEIEAERLKRKETKRLRKEAKEAKDAKEKAQQRARKREQKDKRKKAEKEAFKEALNKEIVMVSSDDSSEFGDGLQERTTQKRTRKAGPAHRFWVRDTHR